MERLFPEISFYTVLLRSPALLLKDRQRLPHVFFELLSYIVSQTLRAIILHHGQGNVSSRHIGGRSHRSEVSIFTIVYFAAHSTASTMTYWSAHPMLLMLTSRKLTAKSVFLMVELLCRCRA